jgi:uncharacterized cupredoxin-like copper-binding protein
MSHSRIALLSVLSVVVAAVGYASATAYAAQHAAPKTTHVTVTMTEFKFKLSVKQLPRTGTVIFKVVNHGKIPHDFKIGGKKTPNIKPGKSATLKVVFKKKARYAYLCTVKGHAALGMKGVLAVGVKPPATTTTAPTTTTTTTTGGGATTATCAAPQSTTVNVSEFEWGFTLSAASVPCGSITFNQTNTGTVAHNFDLEGVAGAVGTTIDAGGTTSFTVTVVPGRYTYICDVSGHAQLGMIGTLMVTG